MSTWIWSSYQDALEETLVIQSESLDYSIKSGSSLSSVIYDLANKKIIKQPRYLLWYARLNGLSNKMKTGDYRLTSNHTAQEFLDDIFTGKVVQFSLTVIEGWSFLDALYMTITTITTVGYDEVHPLSDTGRIFSIFLIVGGVGGALYTLTTVVGYFVEGQFGSTLGRRQMKNRIARLKDHFIICGYGRVGQEVARAFAGDGMPFVVIDSSQERIVQAEKDGFPYLLANATEDEVLKEAGIEKARGLVSAVGGDVDNTYITLSARGLRPDLFIAVRASDREAEVKLTRAGANRIVSPYSIGARRLAMLALRPAVVDFIDTVSYGPGRELKLENIAVSDNSPLAGTTVEAGDTL